MKKIVFVLMIVGLVFISCNSEVADRPEDKLQGKWYLIPSAYGPIPENYLEFSGNTMGEYCNGFYGIYRDYSGPFTCTETTITFTFYSDNFTVGYFTDTIHYSIGEWNFGGKTYSNVLFTNPNSNGSYSDGHWQKLDTPPPPIN